MRKNREMLLMVMILTLVMFGCSNDTTSEKTKNTDQAETTQSTDSVQSTSSESPEDTTQTEAVGETVSDTQEVEALDSSLEGIALLNALSTGRPTSMKMVMETNAFGSKIISTMYYEGDNSRTETVIEGIGTNVVINNAADKVMYNYVEGSGQGVKIVDANSEAAEEAGLMMDMSAKLAEITDASSEDIIARVETLDGRKWFISKQLNPMMKWAVYLLKCGIQQNTVPPLNMK